MADDSSNYIGHYYLNGYHFFTPVAMSLVIEQGLAPSERMSAIHQLWKNMTPTERQMYHNQAEQFNLQLCEEYLSLFRTYQNEEDLSLPDTRKCYQSLCQRMGVVVY